MATASASKTGVSASADFPDALDADDEAAAESADADDEDSEEAAGAADAETVGSAAADDAETVVDSADAVEDPALCAVADVDALDELFPEVFACVLEL